MLTSYSDGISLSLAWHLSCRCIFGGRLMLIVLVGLQVLGSSKLLLVRELVDTLRLNGAAHAKQYRQFPGRLFVTSRGSTLSTSHAYAGNASLTVLTNLTSKEPTVLEWWPSPFALEGQDLTLWDDQALVVTDIARGVLMIFNASRISNGPVSVLNLSAVDQALHVRLFHRRDGRRFALVTSGEASGVGRMVYVDVTDPQAPCELGSLDLGLSIPEGLLVHDETATGYFGGCNDTKLVVVDLSPLPGAPVVRELMHDQSYVQMVSTPDSYTNDAWFALYGQGRVGGGIAHFRIESNGLLTETSRLLDPGLEGSNRVILSKDQYGEPVALLPLEHSPVGGLAVVSLAPAWRITELVHFLAPPGQNVSTTRCFCATGATGESGSMVHAFVGQLSTMFTFMFVDEPASVLYS